MTSKDKIARRKLSLLELASELSNVSRACKVMMGYSRQQFYEIRRNFQTYGAEGLVDRLPGAKGPHPNRVPAEIEQAVLDHALAHPCHGALRVEQELRLRGLQVSSGGVRGVWRRHDLLTKHERLLRLDLTQSEVLVLMCVAYFQPITRGELSSFFGKEISRDLIGHLRGAKLIASGPRSPTPGAPYTYVTTKEFLLEFGLDTLRDLPDFEALEDAGLLSKEKLLAGDIPAGMVRGEEEGEEATVDAVVENLST